ncbi:hypothetical protein EVAR_26563_1 [Eumeta japonica]|uniref:Uncharacterized protein n=1 Tax=Eumeta variegata TaxID=151549 RepID=A0A4C1W463_EUMVA|nr:hypothetical protein EVAR_26563_1 [Eumeta japonica]
MRYAPFIRFPLVTHGTRVPSDASTVKQKAFKTAEDFRYASNKGEIGQGQNETSRIESKIIGFVIILFGATQKFAVREKFR